MFIYNVTVNVAPEVCADWLKWMQEIHIPDVMKTGCFVDNRILKVLNVEDLGETFSVQYYFSQPEDIETYQQQFAPALQADHKARYGDKCLAFRTLLEIID